MGSIRRALRGTGVCLVASMGFGGLAEAAPKTVIEFKVKPTEFTRGSDGQIRGLTWTDWGRSTSTARGTAYFRAGPGGGPSEVPVTMVADRLTNCGPWRVYRRVRARWHPSPTGFVPAPYEYKLDSCPPRECGSVIVGSNGFETMWATAVSCRTARTVARKCIAGKRTGWRKKRGSEVILSKGRRRIELQGRVGGSC